MSAHESPLDHVRVASPCPMAWDAMQGDASVRFCSQCKLHVYNLSGMDRAQAEALVQQTEGRLCVRFFRRRDGKLLTQDCPAGLAAVRKRALKLAGMAAGILLTAATCALTLASGYWRDRSEHAGILRDSSLRQIEPFASLLEWLDPAPTLLLGSVDYTSFVPASQLNTSGGAKQE